MLFRSTLSFMRVVEDGLVRLTDNVSRYIPGFKPWESVPEKKGERVERQSITITNLLNHTSGLPSYVGVPGFLARYEQYGDPLKMNLRDSLTAYLTDGLERLNRPGEVMRYSCLNFITLQTIIERTTGMRLDHFAKQEVFDKLRLKNTWYNCIADAERPFSADAKIVPTEVQPDGKVLYGEVHDPLARVVNGGVSGNAGVFSTAEDLAVIASLMLNDGVIRLPADGIKGFFGGTDRIRLYSKNTVDAFTRIPAGYEEHGRALGWDIGVAHGSYMGELLTPGSLVNHSGYTGTSMAICLYCHRALLGRYAIKIGWLIQDDDGDFWNSAPPFGNGKRRCLCVFFAWGNKSKNSQCARRLCGGNYGCRLGLELAHPCHRASRCAGGMVVFAGDPWNAFGDWLAAMDGYSASECV